MKITAGTTYFQELNQQIREASDKNIEIDKCYGQRFICAGSSGKEVTINGTPGNGLGYYLNGTNITVKGNCQEATGDTMNEGTIVVHGNCGDGTGYGMRGGNLYIKGNSGYRTGIHMKSYKDKYPIIVIGGAAGSFLGEYQAGGVIIVLGMNTRKEEVVAPFCGTGMHGGKMYIRCSLENKPKNMPKNVIATKATEEDLKEIDKYLDKYCKLFSEDKKEILNHDFIVLTPDTKNPFKQLYCYS